VAAPLTREVREATAHGGLYLRRLRHAQLVLSLLALVVFGGLIGALPLVILLVEEVRRIEVLGVPIAIGLVVVPPFAFYVALAWIYEHRANGLDAAFREVLDDGDDGEP
jgi:uncharacterized membrane protein